MRAIVQDRYGVEPAEVLRLAEIDRPEVGAQDVLVEGHAAGVHIGDWHVMTGLPYLLRVAGFGFRAPKVRVRGMDVAGTVAAVGPEVTDIRVGDEVFGTGEGAFADYVATGQDTLAPKPGNLTFAQAAALPTSGMAALQALRDAGGLTSGQRVLLLGASGGVGLFAVQIAKAFGAEVIGVCSPATMDLVRSAGADQVIDYTRTDPTAGGPAYDLILDMGGNRRLSRLRRALRPGGRLVMVGSEQGNRMIGGRGLIQAMLLTRIVPSVRPLMSVPNQADLRFLAELVETGRLSPVIDRTFPLGEVPAAIRYLRAGDARGKVVIAVR